MGEDSQEDDKKDTEAEAPEGDKKASKEVVEELNSGFDEVSQMLGDVAHRVTNAAGEGYEDAKEHWKKLEPQVKDKLKNAKETLGDVSESAATELKGLFGELKSSLSSLRKKL